MATILSFIASVLLAAAIAAWAFMKVFRKNHQRGGRLAWATGITAILLCACLLYNFPILIRINKLKGSNPTMTALMAQRLNEAAAQGKSARQEQTWVGYDQISPNLVRAVIAGEDYSFFNHSGFDFDAIGSAIEYNRDKQKLAKGASTISQQLAKNLFLSTSKNIFRKLHEAAITCELESLLGKRRILEIYLNVIEWGDGVYGAEAAAQHYFAVSASELNQEQAAFLSAILPQPRSDNNPNAPAPPTKERMSYVLEMMRNIVLPSPMNSVG